MMSRLMRELANAGVKLVATSNTLPGALGEGRFAADDFKREIQVLADQFEVHRVDGEDFRHRGLPAAPEPVTNAEFDAKVNEVFDGKTIAVDSFADLVKHLEQVHPSREVTQVQNTHFFKDFNPRSKEKITYFPKVFYRQSNGLIHILVEITLGKYQEPLLNLEKKLESGLYCELTEKELKDSYIEYTLLYDMIANRISSEEMHSEKGSLKLMKNLDWTYDTLPHLLIAGGTGSGKTYFILTLIEALVKARATVFVLDPKNADLADLQTVMPNVSSSKEEISQCVEDFYSQMMQRSKDMKQLPNYKTGENYAYLGLAPNFLIFDEYVAFMEMLTPKESANILNKLKQIVMLGRQAGFFLILACQRPDAKYLGDGIRDQFNLRVALGRMSDLGYSMMFGETNKQFFLKKIKGRGYIDTGTNVISEFYTPNVPKGHDFLAEIQTIIEKNKYQ